MSRSSMTSVVLEAGELKMLSVVDFKAAFYGKSLYIPSCFIIYFYLILYVPVNNFSGELKKNESNLITV